MIKAHQIATLLSVLLPGLTHAGGTSDAGVTTDFPLQATLQGQAYRLENNQQRCALRKPDQSVLMLDIPWPCHFSIGEPGKAHIETFQNAPIVKALHVQTLPDSPRECRSQYQAIRLYKGQLEASVAGRYASCMRGKGDQKAYTGVFVW